MAGHPGTGHAALVEHMCNRLGGYAPDIRHRSDDVMIMRALVGSSQAVTLLPALIGTATPQVAVRPLAEGGLSRSIFTAVRAAGAAMPAVVAVREALHGRRRRRHRGARRRARPGSMTRQTREPSRECTNSVTTSTHSSTRGRQAP